MPDLKAQQSFSTSSDLLTRVRRHEAVAWQRFVTLYAPLVYSWCRRAGVSASDSGDVTQDVFAKVFTAIIDFRHDRQGDTLRGWLRVICRNKVLDHFRRRQNSPQAVGGTDAQVKLLEKAVADDEDQSTVAGDRHGLVHRAAELVRSEFEPRTWQAFWLMVVEHRTTREAGERLGMTPGAVRQAKYMVLRRLREELSGEFD